MKQIYLIIAMFVVCGGRSEIRANTENIKSFDTGCDAQSGTSPGEVFICGTETFDLYPLLLGPVEPGGSWSGPVGWNGNGTSNGPINPSTDSFGTYIYSVEGTDGCISATSIDVVLNDLGMLAYRLSCDDADVELTTLLDVDSLPEVGIWVAPDGSIVPEGLLIPENIEGGDYIYLFDNANGCQSSVIMNVSFAADQLPFQGGYNEYCDPSEAFCFTDVLNDPEGTVQYFKGQWSVATVDGVYVGFYIGENICGAWEEWSDLGVDFIFTFVMGVGSCSPFMLESLVHFEPVSQYGDTATAEVCGNFSEANLSAYLPAGTDPDGYWIDADGNTVPDTIDPGNYAGNNSTYFSYISAGDDGCERMDVVEVSFLASSLDICTCQFAVGMYSNETVMCAGEEAEISIAFTGSEGPFTATVSSGESEIELSGATSPLIYTVSPGESTTYTLLSASDLNCSNETGSDVTITVENIQNAGTDIYWEFCAADSLLNLVDILDDAADGGGFFLPETYISLDSANSGNYFYVVGGPLCPADTAVLVVEISEPLIATNVEAICSEDSLSFIVSYEMTGGSQPYAAEPGGAWTGTSFVSNPISITASGGSAQFLVSDAGACPSIAVFASILDGNGENLCDQLVRTSELKPDNESLLIYPNPWDGSGTLGIELNHPNLSDQMVTIQMYDLTGRVVYHDMLNFAHGTIKVDLPPEISLCKGIYLLSFETSVGLYTSKLLLSQ